eukprot:EG_transcript_16603
MTLSDEQVEQYHAKGYIFLPGFAKASVAALKAQMKRLVEDFDPGNKLATFDTIESKQAKDEYFLKSGDKIRFFLEDEAVVNGQLVREKALAINKCGHALHTNDDIFRVFCSDERVRDVVCRLGYQKPTIIQSMYIFKPPHIGGAVLPHQDDSFLLTEPRSCVGLWVALDDADASNGCMWVAPGSHKLGITRRFALNADKTMCANIPADAPAVPEVPDEDYVCVEAKAGDCLVFHGSLIHKSDKNVSELPRNAFTMHIVEGQYPMVEDCWLQAGCACLRLYN